jgi:O-antigen/teichoic acid export membrane protein
MSRKVATIIQSSGGLILTAISIIQGLLLVPLYLKYISIKIYGYWLTIVSIVTLLSVLNFAFGNIVIQKVASSFAQKNFQSVVDYYINSIILLLFISLIYVIIGIWLSYYLESIMNIQRIVSLELLKQSYFIYLGAILLSFYNDSLRGFSQSLLKPLYPLVTSIIARVSGIILVIVFLINNLGILALPVSLLITESIIFLLNVFDVLKKLNGLKQKYIIKLNILKEYVILAPSLFLARAGNLLSDKAIPLIVTNTISAEATVAYTLAKKLADVVLQIDRIFVSSLASTLSHLIGEVKNTNSKKIADIVKQLLEFKLYFIVFLLSLYIVFNKAFISLWISSDVMLEQSVINFISFSIISIAVIELFKQILYSYGDFRYVSAMMFLFGLEVTCLSIITAPFIGLLGVVISVFVSSLLTLYLIYKRIRIKGVLASFDKGDIKQLFLTLVYPVVLTIIVPFTMINVNNWFRMILCVFVFSVFSALIIYSINSNNITSNIKKLRR